MHAPRGLLVCLLLGIALSVRAQYAAAPMTTAGPQPECPAGLASSTLSFTATGQVFGVPDQAQISISVTAQAENAQDARDEAASVASQIYALLDQSDAVAASEDISTTYIGVSPVSKYNDSTGTSTVVGFQYTNALSVTVRNVTGPALAQVLDAVVEAGGAITSISNVNLQLSDAQTNQLTDQARRAAVANAMATAELYSQALQVRLGPLLSFQETSSQSTNTASTESSPNLRTMAAASTATPVALGQQLVQATVQASFTICSPQIS